MNGPAHRWIDPPPVQVQREVLEYCGDLILAEALARRGVITLADAQAFLDPRRRLPTDPTDLPDLCRAADRVEQAIRSGECIGVWGDFDVDGQTSTALLVSTLRSLGANVIFHIPVRAHESHGVTVPYLEQFIHSGAQLVLTCDTGVTAHEAAAYARAAGVDFLITDHHTLPPELPDACAIVNPQRLPEDHPLRPLCGVGTAYQLALELLRRAGREPEAARLLDLVALGTVADVASLTGANRDLVQRGLQVLRDSPRPAVQALLRRADVNAGYLSEEHIGFILAPRFNAVGRLEDSNPMVEFLLGEASPAQDELAGHIETLNARRKLLCRQVLDGALAQIKANPALLDEPVLVLAHPLWPAGVVGIVASSLVELYHRPAVLISTPPGEVGRASARSVDGINITAAIAENAGFLLGYGGHPMAAGFSLQPERIPEFRRALSRTVRKAAAGLDLSPELHLDAWLPLENATLDQVETLDRLAPFGAGNPPLVFASRGLIVQNARPLRPDSDHLRVLIEDASGVVRTVMWWNGVGLGLPTGRFDLAYTLRASSYRGSRELSIEWLEAREIDETAPTVEMVSTIPALDFRASSDPQGDLQKLIQQGDWLVWGEGEVSAPAPLADRYAVTPCDGLVVWSTPPGPVELRAVLARCSPRRVAFFNIPPAADQLAPFLTRLAGLLRFAVQNRSGQVTLEQLAAATAQRITTVRLGVEWWCARGNLTAAPDENGAYHISEGGQANPARLKQLEAALTAVLKETAAYRAYYLRAAADALAVFSPLPRKEKTE